jgi:murein DD-endopeptidase MepM/ murein hydrolase activator NlpD
MGLILLLSLFIQEPILDWPVRGTITSGYGPRWGSVHKGVDISAAEGTWVRSASDGLVIWAGKEGGYGNLVIVKHGDGFYTYYAHLQSYCVFQWQRVKKHQKLGRVGATGNSTGPHLHFEVRLLKQAQDPLTLLPPIEVTPSKRRVTSVGGP